MLVLQMNSPAISRISVRYSSWCWQSAQACLPFVDKQAASLFPALLAADGCRSVRKRFNLWFLWFGLSLGLVLPLHDSACMLVLTQVSHLAGPGCASSVWLLATLLTQKGLHAEQQDYPVLSLTLYGRAQMCAADVGRSRLLLSRCVYSACMHM